VSLFWDLLAVVLWLFLICMVLRVVLDWVQFFARDWRPRGALLVVAEGVYTVTDPPLRTLRRVIPPLTLGQVRLDLAFLILFVLVTFLLSFVQQLGAAL
jgi:YggT family protein